MCIQEKEKDKQRSMHISVKPQGSYEETCQLSTVSSDKLGIPYPY
jgi:hypothetical protein